MERDATGSLDSLFQEHNARVLAALIRSLGDFDLAEDALQDAWTAASLHWPKDGVPANPAGWLYTSARRRALDRIRKVAAFRAREQELRWLARLEAEEQPDDPVIADDRLRLIFTCCHPALPMETRVALTLRTVGGLSTPEIARAFLVPEATIAQRIVRGKRKIKEEHIPYRVPDEQDMVERLDSVLVIYLVFTEGYVATSGETLVRTDLCDEAIRLARLVHELMPGEAEAAGLLALLLLTDSRRTARTDAEGGLVTLEEQDRSLWNRAQISEGLQLIAGLERWGPYALQAAISGVHARAARPEDTNWLAIVRLYEGLMEMLPTPVVALNHAAAVAMAESPRAGLALLQKPELAGQLQNFHLYHSAVADLHRRDGSYCLAATAYRRALDLCSNPAERRFLERRLREVSAQEFDAIADAQTA